MREPTDDDLTSDDAIRDLLLRLESASRHNLDCLAVASRTIRALLTPNWFGVDADMESPAAAVFFEGHRALGKASEISTYRDTGSKWYEVTNVAKNGAITVCVIGDPSKEWTFTPDEFELASPEEPIS